ncbi:MAG: GAF domain-containing protein [Chloroflexi bacterium]|nr:GAF domain-containing protein [Chloroflexota bacterium]
MFAKTSLRTKLLLAFLGLVVVATGLVSFFNSRVIQIQLIRDAGESLHNLAQSKAQAVGDLIAKQADTLQALSVNRVLQEQLEQLAELPAPTPTERAAQEQAWQQGSSNDPLVKVILENESSAELLRFRNTFPDNQQMLITDAQGYVIAATNQTPDLQHADEAWWQASYREGRGGLYIGQAPDAAALLIALPIYGRQTQVVVGVLQTTIPLNVLLDIFLEEATGQPGDVDLLLSEWEVVRPQTNGFIAAASPTLDLTPLITGAQPYGEMIYPETASLVSPAPVSSFDPGARLPIAALNWYVIAYQDRDDVLQVVQTSLQTTLMTGVGVLLLAGVLAFVVAQLLTTPIIRLTMTVRQLAAGDLTVQAPILAQDEIGTLAETLNWMTSRLRETLENVQERGRMLQASAGVARTASATLDLDTVLRSSVQQICEQFGFYHASVFLVEPGSQMAVLRETTQESGAALKASRHQLEIGSRSLVGTATATRQPAIAQDVTTSPLHYKQPLLPATAAEAAFPLVVGQMLLGVLDVQSKQAHVFTPDVVTALQTLADQIAVAVQNARLYEQQSHTVARLAEADRLKTEFLASMSHELRTPLNSIIGFSQIMLKGMDGPLSEMQRQDIETIHTSGQHLLGIINNLLDLSKIEAGMMVLSPEEVDVKPLVEITLATLVGLTKEKPIRVYHTMPETLPPVLGDKTRLRQILLNLISNAAKFTDEGEIEIAAAYDDQFVTLRVRDTGIGIAPEKQAEIFEQFTQLDNSNTRRYEGTGLGLPITKKLVELHNGTVSVQSQPASGSTFSFSIPRYHPVFSKNGHIAGYTPADNHLALNDSHLS